MLTIKRKLSILFIVCSIAAIALSMFFVNVTISNKFNEYMVEIQNKRYERIVSYFQQLYKKDKKWTKSSGIEIMHEAYMGNYCVTLLDKNKKVVWGMNPADIKYRIHLENMKVKNKGVYSSKRFPIKVSGEIVGYTDIGQYSSLLMSEDDLSFKNSVNKSIILSGIVALVIVMIISLYFSREFAIPIKQAADMSVNLSKGNFHTKYGEKSTIEELENLRKSMNILAEKLSFQDDLRKRLVSDISHEIRTPLNVLENNFEAMIDGVVPVTKEKLIYLNEEVIRFGKLLNNLNTLKEFEDQSMKMNFKMVDLAKLAAEICSDFQMEAESKNIDMGFTAAKGYKYIVRGDEDKLRQVFINLLSNAIKFTQPGGEVAVKLYLDSKNVNVEVTDNGIGISNEDLPFIFERLYRGDKSRHKSEGNGIGLTIVKNILDLHNAEIDVDSEYGRGTSFKISFKK
ncbi:sensor histidine kinase [Clostridium oryzae]|uniref:histidine kinase n=1 Tax=Clostridium oryzae TaxID=1450648 RepID=A0A1V4I6X1_9CLOT|nr:ATP-binding protein [Clostridium oryzae]OPJ55738.1 alkaline phosphatase synthesis sensor protein PhoR [Clostridium oryzae]